MYRCFKFVSSLRGVTSSILLCDNLKNSSFFKSLSGVKSLIELAEYLMSPSSGISLDEKVSILRLTAFSRPFILLTVISFS